MMGLQHVNTFILPVSNRNSKQSKEQTCFALWASQTPTCLMSAFLPVTWEKKESRSPTEANLYGRDPHCLKTFESQQNST